MKWGENNSDERGIMWKVFGQQGARRGESSVCAKEASVGQVVQCGPGIRDTG